MTWKVSKPVDVPEPSDRIMYNCGGLDGESCITAHVLDSDTFSATTREVRKRYTYFVLGILQPIISSQKVS